MIDRSSTIDEQYDYCLRLRRSIERDVESGKAICQHCQQAKAKHLPQGDRCNTWTTDTFLDIAQKTHARASKAIELMEQLLELE